MIKNQNSILQMSKTCLMFLIDVIKPNVENKFKTCFFTRLFGGGKSEEYKIKPVLFLFVLGLLAAINPLLK